MSSRACVDSLGCPERKVERASLTGVFCGCSTNCISEGLIMSVTPLKPEGVLFASPRMMTGSGLESSNIVSPFQNSSGLIKGLSL